MPKHVRHRLISDLRKTCDSLTEFILFEGYSSEEKQELETIKKTLDNIRCKIWNISLAIEERNPDVTVPIPLASQPDSMFTWEEHESKVGKTKLLSEIEKMKQQLRDLEPSFQTSAEEDFNDVFEKGEPEVKK